MILLIILAIAFGLYFWEKTKDWAIKGQDQTFSNDPRENPVSTDKYQEELKKKKQEDKGKK